MRRNPLKKSWPQVVIDHMRQVGRITDATARAAYGGFRLADAIYRLRGERRDLLRPGEEIITVERLDVAGNLFGEYRLLTNGRPHPKIEAKDAAVAA